MFIAPFLLIAFAVGTDSDARCLGIAVTDDTAAPRRVCGVRKKTVPKLRVNLSRRKKSIAVLVAEHGHGRAVVDGNNLGAHIGAVNLADGRFVGNEVHRFIGLEVVRVEIRRLGWRCLEMRNVEQTVEPVLRMRTNPTVLHGRE